MHPRRGALAANQPARPLEMSGILMSAKPDLRSTAMSRRQRRDRTARALNAVAETTSERRRQELLDYVVRINMGVARTVAGRYFHRGVEDRKSTRLNSSHGYISYAVFCL